MVWIVASAGTDRDGMVLTTHGILGLFYLNDHLSCSNRNQSSGSLKLGPVSLIFPRITQSHREDGTGFD